VTPARPLPVPDAQSAPFWEAGTSGILALAKCARCRRFAHPPDAVCPHCGSTDPQFTFEPVARHGRVCSWTVVRQSFVPGFDDDVPFVLVDVEIDGTDVRLIGRLVDGPGTPIAIGDVARVVFEPVGDGLAVPAFTVPAP
jgi:uncharacterized OB-fold protein